MKKIKYPTLLVAAMLLVVLSAFRLQDDAVTHFGKYMLRSDLEKISLRSVPSLEQCKDIFNSDSSALSFRAYVEKMTAGSRAGTGDKDETFVDVRVNTFTTEDILAGKGNYAGGMTGIANRLKAGITFYEVEYLRTKGAEAGMAYKYWVKLNDQWVFLPKPWRAF